jgi:hypothetical protein
VQSVERGYIGDWGTEATEQLEHGDGGLKAATRALVQVYDEFPCLCKDTIMDNHPEEGSEACLYVVRWMPASFLKRPAASLHARSSSAPYLGYRNFKTMRMARLGLLAASNPANVLHMSGQGEFEPIEAILMRIWMKSNACLWLRSGF